jgi:hypothetical protein
MSAALMLYLTGSAGAGIVVAGWRPERGSSARPHATIIVPLAGVLLALLSVGIVSGTMTRHLVQTAPLLAATWLVACRSRYGVVAALPLFSFWLGLMLNIWLYLAGLLHLIGGQFTSIEIALTVVIGVLCSVGLVAAGRQPPSLSRARRLVVAGLLSILQVAAFIASFSIARR